MLYGPFLAWDKQKQTPSYLLFFLDSHLVPIRGTGLVSTWLGLWLAWPQRDPECPPGSSTPIALTVGSCAQAVYAPALSSQQLHRTSGMPPFLCAVPFGCLVSLSFLSDDFFFLGQSFHFYFGMSSQDPPACPHFFPTTPTPPQRCCHWNGQSFAVSGCAVLLATNSTICIRSVSADQSGGPCAHFLWIHKQFAS